MSSLFFNTTGYNNVAIGISALSANTTGTFNTAVGSNAGSNITTGSSNITIGETTQVVSATGSNQLNIGNWIYGTSGNIGIGTGTALTARLTVAGTVQITGGTPGVGRVLTSDASGLASWMNPSEMPIGAVVAFNTATCPTGWVAANGSGTIDLRGEFIRGLDSGRGIDISRVLGTLQTDGTRDHTHAFTALQNMNGGDGMYDHNGVSNVVGAQDQHPVSRTSGLINAGGNGGTETRPRNVALLYCTKISSSTSTVSNNLTWSNVTGTSTGDVTLATTGNVGVGTTGPTAKLEVN